MHDLPPAPGADEVAQYRQVVVAGHRGTEADVRPYLQSDLPLVRQAALSALARLGRCETADIETAFSDAAPQVRARAVQLGIEIGVDPRPLLDDDDPTVVEVACFGCGEIDWQQAPPIAELSQVATDHEDALCRESAAAALGAIGHPAGLDAVLAACTDRVTVRRRATLALAAFDDPRAETALHHALDDNDWQVRQAAEDLLEVGRTLDAPPDPDAYAE